MRINLPSVAAVFAQTCGIPRGNHILPPAEKFRRFGGRLFAV
jgi:hypothetical protein